MAIEYNWLNISCLSVEDDCSLYILNYRYYYLCICIRSSLAVFVGVFCLDAGYFRRPHGPTFYNLKCEFIDGRSSLACVWILELGGYKYIGWPPWGGKRGIERSLFSQYTCHSEVVGIEFDVEGGTSFREKELEWLNWCIVVSFRDVLVWNMNEQLATTFEWIGGEL